MNPVLNTVSREERRAALKRERQARASGRWGEWQRIDGLHIGHPGGWLREVEAAHKNNVFCVLRRRLPDGIIHLAIASLTGIRPTWHEAQRIKNELAGSEATAIEIYPPDDEVVDGADMFHLWVLSEAATAALRQATIHRNKEAA